MPKRVRLSHYKGLPPNLYFYENRYKYRHPVTGKFSGMGVEKSKAVEAAQQLNALLMAGHDLVARVIGKEGHRFADFLKTFMQEIVPPRQLARNTLTLYHQKMVHIRQHLGDKLADEITIKDVADFLAPYPPRSSNQFRALLVDIFKHAIARGICETNPADATLPKEENKQRIRMTLEGFNAIYQHAESWLQNAMDIAIHTLQRREDIANMRFEDIREGYLYVIQEKTEKHGEAAHLKIKINAPLQVIIDRCRNNIVSPFIIHRLPERRPQMALQAKEREHLTQCLPEVITRRFKRARDQSGFYDHLPIKQHPGFHEIRSLGAKLYQDAGIDPQQLLGHTKPEMTQHYLSGHEIRWTETSAGLKLPARGKYWVKCSRSLA